MKLSKARPGILDDTPGQSRPFLADNRAGGTQAAPRPNPQSPFNRPRRSAAGESRMRLKPLALGALLAVFVAVPGQPKYRNPMPRRAKAGVLERLAERTGVYGTPDGENRLHRRRRLAQKLPNNWIIGRVGGLYSRPTIHLDLQRPRTLTNDGRRSPAPPARPRTASRRLMGNPRPTAHLALLSPAPSVMEFDSSGKLLRTWGRSSGSDKCNAEKVASGRPSSCIFVDPTALSSRRQQRQRQPNGSAGASTNGADGMI